MKKNGHEGFVMAEVLITVMIVMVFGTLLFSSASRRYARAERNIAKVEETVKDSDRPVTGFWADQAVMEEIFADGE